MSDGFQEDQELIEGARRALSPTPADAARVLKATRGAIASAAVAGAYAAAAERVLKETQRASASTAVGADAVVAGLSSVATATAVGAARVSAWKLGLSALAIAVLSGGVGYYLGFRAPRVGLERSALSALAAKSVAVPVAVPAAVAARVPLSEPVPDRTSSAATALSSSSPGQARPVLALSSVPRVASKHGTPLAAEPPPDAPLAFSTQEEITAMRRIERALREHEPQRALALLFELDRNVPEGKLMQERQAAFAMARCAAGLGSAPQLVAEFAARYRNSAYLARVRQTCAAQTASTPASPSP